MKTFIEFLNEETFRTEAAVSHGHPMEDLKAVQAHHKANGDSVRIKFRGKRSGAMRSHTVKANGTHFDVYTKGDKLGKDVKPYGGKRNHGLSKSKLTVQESIVVDTTLVEAKEYSAQDFSNGALLKHEVDDNNSMHMAKEHGVYHIKGFKKGKHFTDTAQKHSEAMTKFKSHKKDLNESANSPQRVKIHLPGNPYHGEKGTVVKQFGDRRSVKLDSGQVLNVAHKNAHAVYESVGERKHEYPHSVLVYDKDGSLHHIAQFKDLHGASAHYSKQVKAHGKKRKVSMITTTAKQNNVIHIHALHKPGDKVVEGFKIGDKVRVDNKDNSCHGKVGVVTSSDKNSHNIKFTHKGKPWNVVKLHKDNLKLVEDISEGTFSEADVTEIESVLTEAGLLTKLTRKLIPGAGKKEAGELAKDNADDVHYRKDDKYPEADNQHKLGVSKRAMVRYGRISQGKKPFEKPKG